jgi:hypothetical protein
MDAWPIYDFLKINEQYLHRMTWYTGTCGITVMGLHYTGLTLWSQRFTFMFSLEFNSCFVMDAPCMDGVTITTLLEVWATRGQTLSDC